MSWLSGTPGVAALVALVVLAWLVYRIRRNHRLVRPPVLSADGRPYEIVDFTLSDGTVVPLLDTGRGSGGRPAIVLIPGADGIHQTWRFQVPAFAEEGYRVVSADLRAHVPPDASFDLLCRDVV
ncbi:MAG: hypothetical protein R3266_08210, partial [Gemmatimonadota bacterium]|nr:hypothetical protein [Gemmatimonadota bacterium]